MSSFCTAKATHIFFSKKFQHICISLDVNFNKLLTNDIVSFEQLGPDVLLYSQLSLSGNPRDYLKYFKIFVPQHIRFAELRKKKKIRIIINRITTFHKRICNLTPDVRDILKILWKRGKIAP